jgi:hypothetical protein
LKGFVVITADAIDLVHEFGAKIKAPGFLECIEAMDILSKNNLLAEPYREAYKITIEEMAAFAGVGE